MLTLVRVRSLNTGRVHTIVAENMGIIMDICDNRFGVTTIDGAYGKWMAQPNYEIVSISGVTEEFIKG